MKPGREKQGWRLKIRKKQRMKEKLPVCNNKSKGKCEFGRQNKSSTGKSRVRVNVTACQQGGAQGVFLSDLYSEGSLGLSGYNGRTVASMPKENNSILSPFVVFKDK